MRELTGVIIKDWFKYQISFIDGEHKYLQLRNRVERIAPGPDNLGYVCLWPNTSRLHAPLCIPSLGKQLLKICINKSSFQMRDHREKDLAVQISVIIGHRGMDRLPLLLTTLRSIAAQIDVGLECIVIEQDNKPMIKEHLPGWVRYIFLKTASEAEIYNRSAAFNLGARYAQARLLLLHDNDMLVPSSYCKNILSLANKGYEAINTKRYVFYLTRSHSQQTIHSSECIASENPEYIIQNLEAGGSMGISREAYFAIGGMDEEFIGWGGEDIEFWKRCSLLKRWLWGYEPIIHLWHHSQPLKERNDNPNIARVQLLKTLNIRERINLLKTKNWQDTTYA